jgi:hypothetical protein
MVAARSIRIGVGLAPHRDTGLPQASALSDNFDDNSRDASKWTAGQLAWGSASSTGVTVAETSGQLQITGPTSVAAERYDGYISALTYDFTGDSIFFALPNWASFQPGDIAFLVIGTDGQNNIRLNVRNNAGTLELWLDGLDAATYYSISHVTVPVGSKWFRLRHSVSPDRWNADTAPSSASDPPASGDWTNQLFGARTTGFRLTSVYQSACGGCFGSNASPTTIQIDGFNTATTATVSNEISGTSSITFSPSATATGLGTLGGSSALTFADSGTLTGLGSIAGSSSLVLSPSGTATGLAALIGTTALTFTPSATATGLGSLTGSSTLVLAPSGTVTGLGSLLGNSPLTFAPAGTVIGLGTLAGTAALSLAGSATVTGIRSLLASTALSFSLSGTVGTAGSNNIAGTAALTFSSLATLQGLGQLQGAAQLSLTLSGVLTTRPGPRFVPDPHPANANFTPSTRPSETNVIGATRPGRVSITNA